MTATPTSVGDDIVALTTTFCRERFGHRAIELANTHDYPYDVFDELAAAGYFTLFQDERWGGTQLDLWTFCRVIEEMAKVSNTLATLVVGQLQGSLPLRMAGSSDQLAEHMPDIVAGRKRVAMALTEPGAGSDVAGIATIARRDGDDFVLNGRKAFITMASVADLITVYAKLSPGRSTSTIQGFLIPKDTPGLVIGRSEDKMGSSAVPTSEVLLEDCRVPASSRLGEAGTGFTLAMSVLDSVRTAIAARAVGLAQGALDVAVDYMRERTAFEQPLASFQGLQFMVADMAMGIEAARGLVQKAAIAIEDNDPHAARYCSMAKCFATDTAMRVTTDAVQLLGGYGYMRDYPVEHRFREAKLSQIVDGTNQIQRLIIARSIFGKSARPPQEVSPAVAANGSAAHAG